MILSGMSMYKSIIYLCAKAIVTAKIHTRTTWKGSDNKSLADVKKSHTMESAKANHKIKQRVNKLIFSITQSNMNSFWEVQQAMMENVPA